MPRAAAESGEVEEALPLPGIAAKVAAIAAGRSMGQLHALVVDDSSAMRRQLCYALQRVEGLDSVEAADGADAWRKLSTATFDIVLTDINMPLLDGLKLVALMRAGGPHQRVPVVVITTEGAEADRKRALSLGASAYLVKPVQASQVVDCVRSLLRMA